MRLTLNTDLYLFSNKYTRGMVGGEFIDSMVKNSWIDSTSTVKNTDVTSSEIKGCFLTKCEVIESQICHINVNNMIFRHQVIKSSHDIFTWFDKDHIIFKYVVTGPNPGIHFKKINKIIDPFTLCVYADNGFYNENLYDKHTYIGRLHKNQIHVKWNVTDGRKANSLLELDMFR